MGTERNTGEEYGRLFGALPQIKAPAYLCERVLVAVSRERVRASRTRLVFSSGATVISLFGVVVAVRALFAAMNESGFSSYAWLAVSDSGSVFANAHSFFYTLLESLPGIEVIVTLALLAVLIQSLRVLIISGIEYTWARPITA